MPSQTFTSSGSWSAPANLAGPPKVEAWGPGANGQNHSIAAGGGSGGGEYAAEPSLGGVTPGSTTLTITIGGGGSSTSTTVTGGSVTVTAHAGGVGASGSGGAGGTGSTNTTHHDGGAGAAQSGGTGGGGGGSGGSSSAGNPGSGSTGGAAVTGGGAGGNGGSPGSGGGSPGGGGGGASSGSGGAGAGGQVIITWTVASTHTGQVSAKGRAAAVRGSGKGTAGAKYVAFPSHFTPPVRPAAGKMSAVRGKGGGNAGKFTTPPPFVVSPFTLPVRPAKGATGRRGSSSSTRGAPYIAFPSPFYPPHGPARGRGLLVPGRGQGSAGARFVLIQTSPFTLPKGPARGRSAARRGIWSAGSATGRGAPFVPRTLIISIASAAGRDDYGNPFVQGIQVNQGLIQGQVIAAESVVKGILAPGAVDNFTLNAITVNSGTVSASDVIISGTAGGAFAYSSGGTITQILAGSGNWTVPAGVTSYELEEWAGGAGGGGSSTGAGSPGGGGGGGEYARYNSRTATPGAVIAYAAGAGGTGGGDNTSGSDGGNSVWDTGGAGLTAHGGKGGHASFGLGGAGGTGNTSADAHFSGGSGGTSSSSGGLLGGGGGGSGGTSSAGSNGIPDSGSGGSGAPAVAGGGPGGDGGNFSNSNGSTPAAGPGGGGGGVATNGFTGGNGQAGWFRITYTSSSPQLIASIAGAATTDPIAAVAVPEGVASDHYTVSSNASVPGTPSGGGVFWYDGTALWFKGVSGTAVKIATT